MSSEPADLPDDDDEADLGRGMIGVSLGEDGIVQMQHQDTLETFEFDRADLDEVIGTLASFRMFLEAAEDGGEENGEL